MEAAADFAIRPACIEDLPGFLALFRHLIPDDDVLPEAVARERFLAVLQHPGLTVFGAFVDGRPVSSVTLIVVPNLLRGGASYAMIENVVTHADHRKRGYGRALLRRATETAWSAGCYKVMVMVGSKDPATLRFYEESGFAKLKTGFEARRIPPR
ncbi:GNAT family N-acetyltransferase [Rhizobium sp. BK251]|uniref:GNAT family N-acetyltransferase n=1 Tax=Rhizobium sp. BK251 TaxID=2512125 RepID=UPI001051E153|nr:GNAT family N-acetyltransferase [Rhizobium sp. BK251]TCL74759.1 L-amino acid N-acyltransferase YncA [Rhizobium sp. BK251]